MVDAKGNAFSATPSGAWLPSVIAVTTWGHKVTRGTDWGKSSAPTVILKRDGVIRGGSDPRRARFIFGR